MKSAAGLGKTCTLPRAERPVSKTKLESSDHGGPPASVALHVSWLDLHPDTSLNFQLNRWLAYGGERWLDDVRPVLANLRGYDAWRDTFILLSERAEGEGRLLHAALHLRAAEFFMVPGDSRKTSVRRRLSAMLRDAYGVTVADRRDVPFADATLPTFCFAADEPLGTIVAFGGFDSYIEEFFPIFLGLRDRGWTVVAFEGPGQGTVLEDQGVTMTPEWHGPVSAVLDAFALDDVVLLGISLGGCLALRDAAFEPRVTRALAFDAMTDFLACMLRQLPPTGARIMRTLVRIKARWIVNRVARSIARRRPVIEWGLGQAMHVFGRTTPFIVFAMARTFRSEDISRRVTQDVLMLAGADDHYVPLGQPRDQVLMLTAARSVTSRVFTCRRRAGALPGRQPAARDRRDERVAELVAPDMSAVGVSRLIDVAPCCPPGRTVRCRTDCTLSQKPVSDGGQSIWGSRTRSESPIPRPSMEP